MAKASKTVRKPVGVVGFVALEIYPTTAGGVGIFLYHTIQMLLDHDYDVVLLLDVNRKEFEKFRDVDRLSFVNGSNLHVYQVAELCADAEIPMNTFAHKEIARAARIDFAWEKVLERHEIDLIEYYDYCGPALHALTRTGPSRPAIAVRLHNTVELIQRGVRAPLQGERVAQYGAERACLSAADIVMTPGWAYYDEEIAPLYPTLDREKVQYSGPIHAPVGEATYDPLSKNVVFYGRLSTFKGLDVFLRGAVLALRDAGFAEWLGKFIIIGPEETVASGLSLDEMKSVIPLDQADRFEFTGRMRHAELIERLGKASFACFANRLESFCYAAHEIHTAGVPVILSDTPAFRDHFEDAKTAVFFDRTARDLAEKMIALSKDPKKRKALSRAGLKRAPSYVQNHYAAHIDAARKARAGRGGQAEAVAYVLSNGDPAFEQVTCGGLSTAGVPTQILREDTSGLLDFAGRSWSAIDAAGQVVDIRLDPAPEAAVFLRAGDVMDPAWFDAARATLGGRDSVGAVGCWRRQNDALTAFNQVLLPDAAAALGPGLRTMIRLRPRATVIEALNGRSGEDEASLMIAQRAAGRALLESPMAGVDISQAISLAPVDLHAAMRVDFDRMPNDFLALAAAIDAHHATLAQSATRPDATSAHWQAMSASSAGLVVLRPLPGDGRELMVLRLTRPDEPISKGWSAVERMGDWRLVTDPYGPVGGALKTVDGIARFAVKPGAGIDMLGAPFAGMVEIFYKGERTVVNLNQDEVSDRSLVFTADGVDEVARGQTPTNGDLAGHRPDQRVATSFLHAHVKDAPVVIIADGLDDLKRFPTLAAHRDRLFEAGEFSFEGDSPGGRSHLKAFCEAAGVKTLAFTSQVAITPHLMDQLQAVPEGVEIGVVLSGGRADAPGDTPAERRFVSYAQWSAVARQLDRPVVAFGASDAMRGVFEASGARFAPLPITVASPAAPIAPLADDPVLEIAVVRGESITDNIMHLVNAADMLIGAGRAVSKLWVPREQGLPERVARELGLPVTLEGYDNAQEVEAAPGAAKLALAAFPDDEAPASVWDWVTQGWLPLFGPVNVFDADEALQAALCEPYWEDSRALARRAGAAVDEYAALWERYLAFATKADAAAGANDPFVQAAPTRASANAAE